MIGTSPEHPLAVRSVPRLKLTFNVSGQIPSNLVLTRVSPRLWIPFIEVCPISSMAYVSLIVPRNRSCGQSSHLERTESRMCNNSTSCVSSSACSSPPFSRMYPNSFPKSLSSSLLHFPITYRSIASSTVY